MLLDKVDVSELELHLDGFRASEETLQQGKVALKQCRWLVVVHWASIGLEDLVDGAFMLKECLV